MDNNKQIWRLVSLFILVFEGFGIRLLEGVIPSPISFWTALLLILNSRTVFRMPIKSWGLLAGFIVFYLSFCLLKGVTPKPFLIAGWLSAFFVLSNYYSNKNSFFEDLYKFTRICVYYSLLHIPILFIGRNALMTVDFGLSMKTFYYLFYYSIDEMGVFGLNRITGFCWEPSCWNCLLNINIALSLMLNKKKEALLGIIANIFVFSTTGMMTMFVAILGFFFLFSSQKRIRMIFLLGALLAIIAPLIFGNFEDKIDSGSGATRIGDFYVAQYVVQTSPLFGADLDNITSNQGAMKAKYMNWGLSAAAIDQYEGVGMANAFAGLFVEWGLLVPLCLFYMMFISPLFPEKKNAILVSAVLLAVLMGTPIARTGFFYMFPLSSLFLMGKKQHVAIGKTFLYNYNKNSN